MRWVRLLAFPVLTALLVACGGGDGGSGDEGGSDGASNATAAATSAGSAGDGGSSGSGSSGSGGGSLPDDFDEVAQRLQPPNANETSRFSTTDGLVVGWESSDSVESLKEHYDDAIAAAGFNVIGTMDVGGAHQWFLGDEDGDSVAASVSVAPNSGSGSIVGITVTPPGSTGSGASGGTDSGGGNAEGDVDEMIGRLEPPNATEVSRFSSSDGVVIGWESSDSVDSVKGFYDDAIAEAGLNVYGTTDVQETHSWVIAEESGNGFNGSVTIGPSSSGSGTSVSALLGFIQ